MESAVGRQPDIAELKGGNHLALDYTIPTRGNIYDKNENALAADTEAVALGVVPATLVTTSLEKWIRIFRFNRANCSARQQLYSNAAPLWYVAIGTTTKQEWMLATNNSPNCLAW
jgi:penicillin-binding protein 2